MIPLARYTAATSRLYRNLTKPLHHSLPRLITTTTTTTNHRNPRRRHLAPPNLTHSHFHLHPAATMSSQHINLSSLTLDDTTKTESQVLAVLDAAINSSSPTSLSAEATAGELDKLYSTGKSGDEAEGFLWSFWTIFIGVAKRIPVDDPRLQHLVLTLEKLKAKSREKVEIWGKSVDVWVDTPVLGLCMREAWNERPDENDDPTANAQWISLNSFAARAYGNLSAQWTNFAIWELRLTLEEEQPINAKARETSIITACEWLTHAGKVLQEQGHNPPKLDNNETRMLKQGILFGGEDAGLSDDRYAFWKKRLGSLASETENPELSERAKSVAEKS